MSPILTFSDLKTLRRDLQDNFFEWILREPLI